MKKLLFATFALVFLSAGAMSAFAQQTTRVHFKKGATTSIVTGKLIGSRSKHVFVVRVREGQTLTTENAGKNHITVSIEAPPGSTYEQDMAADCHDRNEVTPTAGGDYRITVTECQKADRWKGSFKMRLRVR